MRSAHFYLCFYCRNQTVQEIAPKKCNVKHVRAKPKVKYLIFYFIVEAPIPDPCDLFPFLNIGALFLFHKNTQNRKKAIKIL